MDYSLLAPEILTAVAGLLILIMGLLKSEKMQRLVGPAANVMLIAILVLVVMRFTQSGIFFGGIYRVDAYASFFKCLFLLAAILVLLSSNEYIARFGGKRSEFYSLMIFAALGMIVMAAGGDLITIYIGLELMTVSFYILTAFLEDKASSEAGLKYLILGAISSAILLFGISLVFAFSGTTVITEFAAHANRQPAFIAGIIFMVAGFAFKIAAVPFHMWAPDIYQGAPIPITTFLAVGSKAAGFAALMRVFMIAFPLNQFNWSLVLAVLAALTMIVGNLIALNQTNVKRLLAYSSIAQAGYILAGLVSANNYGLKGVLFYAMLYVFSNTGAFAVTTAVEVNTGSTDREAFNALSKRSPMLAAIMTVCLLSLAGIPPLAGFAGKFYLFSGAVQAGYLWLAFIGLIMSMVSVYYYLLVAKAMYIGESENKELVKTNAASRFTLWVCLLATLFIGLYPAPLSKMAQYAIQIFL